MITDNEIINQLKKEILELQGNLKFLRGVNKRLLEQCDEKVVELDMAAHICNSFDEELKCAKSEALKEFAKRIKEKRGLYGEIWDEDIDKLVKEMVGDNDGNL